MNDRLLWAALIMVGILVVVTFGSTIGSLLISDQSTTRTLVEGRIFSRGLVLFLIVPTIAALAAYDKITGEAALAALSGIAGYVLGAETGGP